MNVDLTRYAYTPLGTIGKLSVADFWCYTIERPWLNNLPSESCIPTGEYTMKISVYHRGGYPSWEIMDVPGRSMIKIHVANTMFDLLGCIGPGESLAIMKGALAVGSSRKAYNKFMEVMSGHTIAALKVQNAYNLGETEITHD